MRQRLECYDYPGYSGPTYDFTKALDYPFKVHGERCSCVRMRQKLECYDYLEYTGPVGLLKKTFTVYYPFKLYDQLCSCARMRQKLECYDYPGYSGPSIRYCSNFFFIIFI
jgi:hypothetical protein